MGLFDFTVENSTLASRPWKRGLDFWSSFELYPEWKGSTFLIFRGVAYHQRDYWTGTPVVVRTFQNKHGVTEDWTTYCQTATMTRKMAAAFNKYIQTKGCKHQVDFIKPIEVVMDNISDVMPLLRYFMGFNKKFIEDEVVVMEDLLDGDFNTFVSDRGEATTNGSGILDAFSHFTYHHSDRQTLVCGLQGIEEEQLFKLTNPVVHTVSGRHGRKDRGQEGIDLFFTNHVCMKGLCDGFIKPERPAFMEPSAPLLASGTESFEASYTTPVLVQADIHGPPSYSAKDPNEPPPYST